MSYKEKYLKYKKKYLEFKYINYMRGGSGNNNSTIKDTISYNEYNRYISAGEMNVEEIYMPYKIERKVDDQNISKPIITEYIKRNLKDENKTFILAIDYDNMPSEQQNLYTLFSIVYKYDDETDSYSKTFREFYINITDANRVEFTSDNIIKNIYD